MANELKPCPFCGGSNLDTYYCDIEGWIAHIKCDDCDDMIGPMSEWKYETKEEAYDDAAKRWNTRPAAPVEGFRRLSLVRGGGLEDNKNGDYVRFDQAEAIIAARDETIRRQDIALRGALLEVERLKADNAALTARVKELSDLIDGENCADPDKIDALFRRAETTETQLVAARKALEDMIDGYQEYDFVDSKPVLRTIENQSSWIQRARAVLGGKPSC